MDIFLVVAAVYLLVAVLSRGAVRFVSPCKDKFNIVVLCLVWPFIWYTLIKAVLVFLKLHAILRRIRNDKK